jgi:EAL domain-containing protein (putative c-di-GMP-specific phosphodiesterase class I)
MDNGKKISIIGEAANQKRACEGCKSEQELDIEFEYAFQPIVNIATRSVYAHEALIRGPNGESAYSVLSKVTDRNRYQFDQACRVKAVKTAAELQMRELLSINFLPNAVYEPAACIRSTLEACRVHNFSTQQIMFEVTEGERVDDRQHLINIFESYRKFGFKTAIDDFGAGYAGLNLLSEFQPHVVKIDMDLVRNIDTSKARQAIVSGIMLTCRLIGSAVVAEGIETKAERDCLAGLGVELMQGYYFCRPAFKALGVIGPDVWP